MFHWQDGWFFTRLPGGGVKIVKHEKASIDAPIVVAAEIDADSWASIVCSVSAHGETSDRFNTALAFHNE